MIGILEPNGTGKTTLLHAITGLVPRESGAVRIFGKDITENSPIERARKLVVLPQDTETPFPFTVIQVVKMGRYAVYSSNGTKDQERAEEALRICGITDLAHKSFLYSQAVKTSCVAGQMPMSKQPYTPFR